MVLNHVLPERDHAKEVFVEIAGTKEERRDHRNGE
jgi:hypothetical protein